MNRNETRNKDKIYFEICRNFLPWIPKLVASIILHNSVRGTEHLMVQNKSVHSNLILLFRPVVKFNKKKTT